MKTLPVIYVDMDDVIVDYTPAHRAALQNCPENRIPQSVPGFFLNLKPMEGALEAVNRLRLVSDLYILTAPSIKNPHCYTEKRLWIEQYFDLEFTNRLILSPHKGLLNGDFLIDDHCEGRGQEFLRVG